MNGGIEPQYSWLTTVHVNVMHYLFPPMQTAVAEVKARTDVDEQIESKYKENFYAAVSVCHCTPLASLNILDSPVQVYEILGSAAGRIDSLLNCTL